MHLSAATSIVILAQLAIATHVRIRIPPSTSLANPSTLPPSTSGSLTTLSGIYTAPLRSDNTFDFRNVSTGSYLFDVHCATYAFRPLRVDIHDGIRLEGREANHIPEVQAWGTFRGNEWDNKGEIIPVKEVGEGKVGGDKVYGFEVKVVGPKGYFLERSGCEYSSMREQNLRNISANLWLESVSPLSLLKNPMILVAGLSMVLVFGMPYLMDNSKPPSVFLSVCFTC
jgi:hypothetical protein